MTAFTALVRRNVKLFFQDKGMFFSALITPMILLVLYVTFLKQTYTSSFEAALTATGMDVSTKIMEGLVGGELISSLLAVCCVTVAFCSNFLMVQDKVSGVRKDFTISPVKSSTLALGYYVAAFFSTVIVCYVATGIGLLYLSRVGFFLSQKDVLLLLLDVLLLVMFGTVLSSIINCFLSSQGQISAVGTIVSAGYGFLCGAYMPISNFSAGVRNFVSFLPGTYGTGLLRNHMLRGVLDALGAQGVPNEVVESIKDAVDYNLYFFDKRVALSSMVGILVGTILVLGVVYIAINCVKGKQRASQSIP